MTKYTIADGPRHIEFDGDLLGSATSDDGKAQRWTDFELYRTDTRKYVLHKVGRSVVYHADEASCTRQAERITVSQLLTRDDKEFERRRDWTLRNAEAVLHAIDLSVTRLPCLRCRPVDIYAEGTDQVFIRAERDRHSVVVSDTARGVVEALHGHDGDGTQYLTRVAERLLEAAGRNDADVRAAWEVRTL